MLLLLSHYFMYFFFWTGLDYISLEPRVHLKQPLYLWGCSKVAKLVILLLLYEHLPTKVNKFHMEQVIFTLHNTVLVPETPSRWWASSCEQFSSVKYTSSPCNCKSAKQKQLTLKTQKRKTQIEKRIVIQMLVKGHDSAYNLDWASKLQQ